MKKLDLKKDLKELYSPSAKEPELIRVPKFQYFMIDGAGDPNSSLEFQEAVQALYAASYTLKFMVKKDKAIDYPVMPLEGLWWADDADAFLAGNKDEWKWTLMIMQPKIITKSIAARAVKLAMERKELSALDKLRFEVFEEGLSAQIMHIGPYAAEGPTIVRLHAFAGERNLGLRGKHHEIYLSDPRKAKPEKMKTIVRQPVLKNKS
ncbi:MAG TPA: GyrI-like domain-containing protein [Bacteroidota bacterium]|nr:GyrI-like domain-containing protein [Bacteroidota bacterium]